MKLAAVGLLALMSLAALPSYAGVVTGHILALYVRQSDGLVYFETDGVISDRAPCAASNNLWILPNENSDTSKRQYAALLMAKASNLPIEVYGYGTCTRWFNSEDVNIVIVRN
jgi:hypothetical protein